jgi:hypothetical protein
MLRVALVPAIVVAMASAPAFAQVGDIGGVIDLEQRLTITQVPPDLVNSPAVSAARPQKPLASGASPVDQPKSVASPQPADLPPRLGDQNDKTSYVANRVRRVGERNSSLSDAERLGAKPD